MQVAKLRIAREETGLKPAGQYFTRVAGALREANEREAALRDKHDAEDAKLEARYRKQAPARRCSGREHESQLMA
jgi:hypothetical protein